MAILNFRRRKKSVSKLISTFTNSLLVLFIGASYLQYQQTGEVTWLTNAFRYLETGILYSPDGSQPLPGDRSVKPASDTSPSGTLPYDFSGQVIKVKDGDSLVVRSDSVDHEIRLYGIDAPEWKQPHGDIARQHLSDLVNHKDVAVDEITIDSYKRSVSVVYLNGRNINVAMVESGDAWWYQRYAPDNKVLLSAESVAKANKRGLWISPNPIPPWDWRKTH